MTRRVLATIAGISLLTVTVGTFASNPLASAISADDASKFAGKDQVVCGIIVRSSILTGITTKDSVRLFIGAPAPNERLTIRIPFGDREKFSPLVESRLLDRQVCVEGKIIAPPGSPDHFILDVTDPKQFKFIGAPPLPHAGYAAGVIQISSDSGIVNPVPIGHPDPKYTRAAMNAHIQGTVMMTAVVGLDGLPHDIYLYDSLDPLFGLDDAAVEAATQWRFRPGMRDRLPVPVLVTIEMSFNLGTGQPPPANPRLQRGGQLMSPPPAGPGRRMGRGQTAPATPTAPPAPIVAGPVSRPKPRVVASVGPRYPLEALRRDWQGSVSLSVTVMEDGRVGDVQVTEPPAGAPDGVGDEAIKCVKQWTFEPALVDGRPVAMALTVSVSFQFR